MWSKHVQSATGPWKHGFMVSCITASIELAAIADPQLEYIPQEAVLPRANTTLRYPVPFQNPKTGKTVAKDLVPDAIFGLEYKQPGSSIYHFFLVEADRGTELTRSSKFNSKSHHRNFLQYREYVGRGLYKIYLNLTAGIMVLNVTTNQRTMENMIDLVGEVSPRGNSYLLFQTCEQFGGYFNPPTTMQLLNTRIWQGYYLNDIRICEV